MKDICPQCGKEFELNKNQMKNKNNGKLVFCSLSCSGKYYANKQHKEETEEQKINRYTKVSNTLKSKSPEKPIIEKKDKVVEHIYKKCGYCGKEIELDRHQKARLSKNKDAIFCCSNLCSNRLKAINNTGKHREGSIRGQHIILKCDYCGNEFELSRSQKQKYNNDSTIKLYCSVTCRNRAISLGNIIKRPTVECAFCGKPFTLSNDQLTEYNKDNTKNFYCSRSCVAHDHLVKKVNYEKRANTMRTLLEDEEYVKDRTMRTQQTNLDKYGVINVLQLEENIEKAKQSKLEKYGDENYNNREQSAKTYYEHYGEGGHYTPKISKINRKLSELLNCDEFEYAIGNFNYDLKKGNTLIEVNPSFTHNCCKDKLYGKYGGLDEEYHFNKTNVARQIGFDCINIFDWDDCEKIKYMLQDKETLYARKLHIKEVSIEDTDEFLNKYHLQDSCKGQSVRLGLYKDDELVEIMTFGKPRYNKNYEWELLRLCTKAEYKVVGGAEKLFNCFVSSYEPKSIMSYCDFSKFSGEVYTRLGFKQKGNPKPSKHWSKGSEHITDNLLRQRGYDQLFNTNYGKGTSNEELMLENGWLPVYDCGQMTFIWEDVK